MSYNAELGSQLKFTIEDLEANRQGYLSEKQEYKHKLDIYIGVGLAIVFAVVFTLLGIAALFEFPWAGVIVIGVGIGLAMMARWYYRVKQKVRIVHSFTGKVIGIEIAPRMGRIIKTTERNFYIAYRSFMLPHLPKRTFTFYYIEPNDLLSVEEVTPTEILDAITADKL